MMSANKLIRGPLWTTLLAALLAAIVVCFFVFVQSGEATPQEAATDEQPPYASVTPRIVGGTAVPNGKYAFMVFIELYRDGKVIAHCGGSLIDRDSVLTAAHCFDPPRPLPDPKTAVLTVGVTDLRQLNQDQIRRVVFKDSYLPRRYNPQRNSSYDVAVLKLDRAVTGIQPIKVATANQNNLETPGRKLTVAGWGVTREGGKKPSKRMREVSVPVVSDSRAKRAYAPLPPRATYFPSLMVAAGKGGKDTCQGDSGGPLFDSGSRTQVGITSTGVGCGRARYPGQYTEVNNPEIRNFIVWAARR
jgi:secreted trypsin-like serine protease